MSAHLVPVRSSTVPLELAAAPAATTCATTRATIPLSASKPWRPRPWCYAISVVVCACQLLAARPQAGTEVRPASFPQSAAASALQDPQQRAPHGHASLGTVRGGDARPGDGSGGNGNAGHGNTLAKDLEFLAGPETEGRGVGTPGGRKAIDFLAARMLALGLAPLPCESSSGYLQAVKVEAREPRAVTSDSLLVFERDAVTTTVALVGDAMPFRGAAPGCVTAPVVFVGYGLTSPELGRDDYAGLDVRGKVVLVLRGLPRNEGADGRALTIVWFIMTGRGFGVEKSHLVVVGVADGGHTVALRRAGAMKFNVDAHCFTGVRQLDHPCNTIIPYIPTYIVGGLGDHKVNVWL